MANFYQTEKSKQCCTTMDIILLRFQYKFGLSQVTWQLISSTENIVYKLPHQLPNDLGNQEIYEKSPNWAEAEPSSYILSAMVCVKNCFACYLPQSLAKMSIF